MENHELQEMDVKILDAIKFDARKTYEQIGKEVGLSRTAVKSKIKAMEEAGVILGYETKIASANGSVNACRFIVEVEAHPDDFEKAKDYFGESSSFSEVYITTGTCHIHAIGVAPNQITMQALCNRLYRELKFVQKISIYSILSVCKDVDGGVEFVKEEKEASEEE